MIIPILSAPARLEQVKGKKGENEERTYGIIQILLSTCLKWAWTSIISFLPLILMAWGVADCVNVFHAIPKPTILNVLRRGHYPLHILVVSLLASDDALEDAADLDISPQDPSQSPMPTKDTQDSILLVGTPIPLMAGLPPDDLPTETFCLTLV